MSSYSSQDFGTYLRTTHGPVQANGKIRIDVLHADGHVGGVSIDLLGNYVVTEN